MTDQIIPFEDPKHLFVGHCLKLFNEHSDFCVYDLETTGFNPEKGAKTLQIAARRYRYDHATRRATLLGEINIFLADPTITEIDPYLTSDVHKIGMIHIRDAKAAAARGARLIAPAEGWKLFAALAQGATLMGQNIISFDNPFANFDAARWGLSLELDGRNSIDTLLLARQIWSLDNMGRNKSGYKLRSLATKQHIPTDPKLDHNALGDINTTWLLFLSMLTELRSYEARFFKGDPDQYKRRLGGLREVIPGPYSGPALTARLAAANRAALGKSGR